MELVLHLVLTQPNQQQTLQRSKIMNDILTYQDLTTEYTNEAETAWSLFSIVC